MTDQLDYIIVGAGPAGLQLGYYFERNERSYKILEAADKAGAFFETYPRHGMLISINKVYTGYDDDEINMRWDWNSLLRDDHAVLFKDYSREYFPPAEALVRYLGDYAERADLDIQYDTRVETIERTGDGFELTDDSGRAHRCRRLIMATGVPKPYIPPIEGIELGEPYTTVSVDPEDFANQRVLILGKSNSAFETADNLVATTALIHVASPNPVQMAWKTHFVGHLRAVNNNFLDTYQLKSQNAVLDGTIQRLVRRDDGAIDVEIAYSHAQDETETLTYDRVILCTGFRFDASCFVSGSEPALCIDDRFPDQTCEWESVNVPDLYFAGTVMQMRDFKKSTSGFIHGFRYNVRSLERMLGVKYHGEEWPHETLTDDDEALLAKLLERINSTSGLWQLFGFLSDLFVVHEEDGEIRHYQELPMSYIADKGFAGDRDSFRLSLEFGPSVEDPFNIQRQPDPTHAQQSTFLHPVIRHYRGDDLVDEIHLLENLFGEWKDPKLHEAPLRSFLTAALAPEDRVAVARGG